MQWWLFQLQVFQKEEIEPLQVKQQDVNWLGQGLIQSAAKSTSTQGLERDLEDVNTRWKTLNKKVTFSSHSFVGYYPPACIMANFQNLQLCFLFLF